MPFQSEKQRRYLWANEPEIARDWSDTYGHRAQGYDGGVMRVPFQGGGNYSQNTAAQNMFGKMYHTLNPFEKFQINQAIDTYGPNEPGITAINRWWWRWRWWLYRSSNNIRSGHTSGMEGKYS